MVEFVGAGLFGIEPHGATFSFAELRAVSLGDQWESQAPGGRSDFFANQIGACGNITPLVRAADLNFTIMRMAQVIKIEGLQQLVTEFGVTDAAIALHP